jgi:thiamine pyrophosphate-dependent acetolactate synthase large subunit-like protein
VENRDALSEAVDRMLAANEPYVLNVNIEADDNVFPMTPGNSAVDYILLSPIEIYRPND